MVTSIPSDSPDDYMNWLQLKNKSDYYGILAEWIAPFQLVPVIETDALGTIPAATVCEELKIQSTKDTALLATAKERVYKEGFYNGRMLVGAYAGMAVQEAKDRIRNDLVSAKMALTYFEPENLVVSRSGDDCVVALVDQWYLNYSDPEWKDKARQCLAQMNVYHDEVRHQFESTLDWLREWACSRSYGLGSRLPWDDRWLIESLSDSTIYPAFYTVSHILHGENVDPSALDDNIWDYIMMRNPKYPTNTGVLSPILERCRREFDYFYPPDLRVSGKDLVPNHLTFYLYNHAAVFPPSKWPRSIRANGYLLINKEKMSKSTGNFLTLERAVESYTADATRLALAEASDGIEDASFDSERANAIILKLFAFKEWLEELQQREGSSSSPPSIHDYIFEAEMSALLAKADQAYDRMMFHDAAKYGFYEMMNARDRYIHAKEITQEPLDCGRLHQYARRQLICMSPIVPHIADHGWRDILKQSTSVLDQPWPQSCEPVEDASTNWLAVKEYRDAIVKQMRKCLTPKKKPATKAENGKQPRIEVQVASGYPEWQKEVAAFIGTIPNVIELPMGALLKQIHSDPRFQKYKKNKQLIPFVTTVLDRMRTTTNGQVLDLGFNEENILEQLMPYLIATLNVADVVVSKAPDGTGVPGTPVVRKLQD